MHRLYLFVNNSLCINSSMVAQKFFKFRNWKGFIIIKSLCIAIAKTLYKLLLTLIFYSFNNNREM